MTSCSPVFVPQCRIFVKYYCRSLGHSSRSVFPTGCFADPKETMTSSEETRGYVSVMASLKFTNFLN